MTTIKVIALARLVCPHANIQSTTALASIDPVNGRELGLQRGANAVMSNVTPVQYRALCEIYLSKACIHETADVCRGFRSVVSCRSVAEWEPGRADAKWR